jgi:hypothetical protein
MLSAGDNEDGTTTPKAIRRGAFSRRGHEPGRVYHTLTIQEPKTMSVRIQFDRDDLRPLVEIAVAEALDRIEEERAKSSGRLAFTEPEAAALLGVKAHVLRDCRRRGELRGAKVGSKIVYTRAELLEFLDRQKLDF